MHIEWRQIISNYMLNNKLNAINSEPSLNSLRRAGVVYIACAPMKKI